jgi:hypothetical protein
VELAAMVEAPVAATMAQTPAVAQVVVEHQFLAVVAQAQTWHMAAMATQVLLAAQAVLVDHRDQDLAAALVAIAATAMLAAAVVVVAAAVQQDTILSRQTPNSYNHGNFYPPRHNFKEGTKGFREDQATRFGGNPEAQGSLGSCFRVPRENPRGKRTEDTSEKRTSL